MAEAVGGEAVDQAERVAEVVVEAGTDHAGRQRAADVADVLAHLVPDVRHLRRRRRALEIDEDRRQAGRRIAAQEIEPARLLQLALEPLGDLLQRVVERGARPRRLHDHGPEGEGRILVAAEAEVRRQPGERHRDHQEDDEGAMLQRPIGEIERHEGAPRSRTFWPGWSAWTPAVTTISPPSSPDEMTDRRRVEALDLHIVQGDRQLRGIDDPYRRLAVDARQRAGRNRDAGRRFELHPPLHRRAEEHGGRRIDQAHASPGRCA